MKIPEIKTVQWFSPENLGGENISSVMLRHMKYLGWREGESPCVIYSGSESQLEKGIEAKKENPDVPFIMNFWGWLPERFISKEWKAHYEYKIDMMNLWVDLVVVPSMAQAEQLRILGMKKEINICAPGVDTAFIFECKFTARRYIDVKPFVLSIGRLVKHKNFASVIYAIKELKITYVIIGSGEEKENLLKLAKDNDVELKIQDNLADNQKLELLSLAKCLVVPSEYEGFGLPIIEGATTSTPVIANRLPIYTELFGENLETFEDEFDLRSKIFKVIMDEDYRRHLSTKEAPLALKYSALFKILELEAIFKNIVSRLTKDKLQKECLAGNNSFEEAYDLDARIDEEFFEYRLDHRNPLFFYRAEPLLETIKEGNVLDVGSSTGVFSYYLARAGLDVTSIDISQNYLELAKKLITREGLIEKVKFIKIDVTRMKEVFKEESFDNVWTGEILEHFKDSKFLISELLRVLRKGGKLVFTVPYSSACYDPFHFQKFASEEDIKNLFSDFPNFEIKEIKKVGAPGGAHNNWFVWGIKKE